MIRTNNIPETVVIKNLEEQGFEVLKNGWPDFVAVDWKYKIVRFIEVKPFTKHLKPRQQKMLKIFEMLGLKYEIWYVWNSQVYCSEEERLAAIPQVLPLKRQKRLLKVIKMGE
ncbi:MAG: VRR-NUC domain-containing protein [Ktedonobacteraceae bacterium]